MHNAMNGECMYCACETCGNWPKFECSKIEPFNLRKIPMSQLVTVIVYMYICSFLCPYIPIKPLNCDTNITIFHLFLRPLRWLTHVTKNRSGFYDSVSRNKHLENIKIGHMVRTWGDFADVCWLCTITLAFWWVSGSVEKGQLASTCRILRHIDDNTTHSTIDNTTSLNSLTALPIKLQI